MFHFLRTLLGLCFGLWKLAYQRLLYEPSLTLALLAGWLAAVALIAAIPMYTDAINQALLRKELQNNENSRRPAFAFFFNYTSNSNKAPWDNYFALDQYMQSRLANALGLPAQTRMHYAKSDLFQLFPAVGASAARGEEPLGRVNLGFITDLEKQITLREGALPSSAWSPGQPLAVLVSPPFAEKLGLQVGETYVLFNSAGVKGAARDISMPVRIAGIWQAKDEKAPFWYIQPSAFETTLLIAPETYTRLLHDGIPRPLYELGWYWVFDGEQVRAGNVSAFLRQLTLVENQIGTLLPGTRLSLSPSAALQRYQVAVAAQSLLILLLGLPVIGLILLFIALMANSMVERQHLEIAILKSRGSGSGQIALLYFLQGITLCLLALALGLPLGWLAAQAMGSTRQFLTFDRVVPLSVAITQESIQYASLAVALALLVTIAPALQAARMTIVTAKQISGRARRHAPLARASFDLILLLAAWYGYYLLAGKGSLARLKWGEKNDPWENPLLFIAPTLFLLAGARLYLSALPVMLTGLERIATWLPGSTLLLALRNLARHSQQYSALITLLLLTAGLGAYITSFAHTLDDNLVARTYYRIGAKISLIEAAGVIADQASVQPTLGNAAKTTQNAAATTAQSKDNIQNLPNWAILPASEHLRVPGVQAVARVGRYPANVKVADQVISAELFGIDREDFPRVAYFRRDFAPLALGALMNELALEPSGILVSRAFLQKTMLQVGSTIELRGLIAGTSQPLLFKIVGVLNLFPTAYPGEQEFFVANLEYIFTELGGPIPYEVWLAVDDQMQPAALTTALEQVGFKILQLDDARTAIAAEQTRPARVGLFGFLSLGFLVTLLLSLFALATHASLMYQRRYIQLGIMRAIGFSARQVAATLAGEQLLTTTLGILGGAWLGLWCSQLFIPFMQLGYAQTDLIPPFAVIIAWREVTYAVGVMLGASLVITLGVAWLLARLRMFQAIKLGETMG